MTREITSELFEIAQDLLEATAYLADVIDGDACGDLGNDSARRDLSLLRARIRSHAVAVRVLSTECEAAK